MQELQWRKSSRSTGGGNCVEVGFAASAVLVRDTKDRDGGTLAVSPTAWQSFLTTLKHPAATPG
ncbi:protein of unknown function [Actinopolyspora xinjiangensis]|uniref:DUF397 domain-containing protein n=1 Tax=Actinopolyspora xinjiangensis TaxID=405564 RepID=A0A1H0UVT4_9ACTN|nr:DUF397 domain-containing protein [Actinopolyspora xinjiangensis]SDP70334.1 protein of unknown function [Actinopolyspora xinjiangensis]